MAGPNQPFNQGATAAGRDPDPVSFSPITAGPVANLLAGTGRNMPLVVTQFMSQMEQEIREGRRKREDGYVGVFTFPNSTLGRPANQLIIAYEDMPGYNTGKLVIAERKYLDRAEHAKAQLNPGASNLHGVPFVGDGMYMGFGAVIYNEGGRLLNFNGQPLAGNGLNAAFNPNQALLRERQIGPSAAENDKPYKVFLQQIDPFKLGLSRNLAEQVQQRIPTGAVTMSSAGISATRPGQPAPSGGGIPGSVDIDTVPDRPGSTQPPPAPQPAPPPAPAPAGSTGPMQPLVGANGQINTRALGAALERGVRDFIKPKPAAVPTPRPDQD